jgi:hypothetical protein
MEATVGATGEKGPGRRRELSGRVEVLSELPADTDVIRLFHRYPGKSFEDTSELLRQAVARLPRDLGRGVLVAGSGFVRLGLTNPTRGRMPYDGEFSEIVDQARTAAEAIRSALTDDRLAVCIGVDVLASRRRSKDRKQVGQFAALISPGCPDISLVAKGFPMVEEELHFASGVIVKLRV